MAGLEYLKSKIEKSSTGTKIAYTILLFLGILTIPFVLYGDQFIGQQSHTALTGLFIGLMSGMWLFHLMNVVFDYIESNEKGTLRVPTRINYSLITISVTFSLVFSVMVTFSGTIADVLSVFIILISIVTMFFGMFLNYLGYFIEPE